MNHQQDLVDELWRYVTARANGLGVRVVSLDELGQAIGTRSISATQIDELMTRLEQAGYDVGGDEQPNLIEVLRVVLHTARVLRAAGQTATVERVAQASGLSGQTVKVALLYSDVLKSSP